MAEQVATVIEELAFMRQTHVGWAEHFERDPAIEAKYVATGEWDGAKEHRRCIDVYDRAIATIKELQEPTTRELAQFRQLLEKNADLRSRLESAEQLTALKQGIVEAADTRIRGLERERQEARNAVSFFASVIKSGESWSAACELSMRSVFNQPPSNQGKANDEESDYAKQARIRRTGAQ
jgi:hypothetical protein